MFNLTFKETNLKTKDSNSFINAINQAKKQAEQNYEKLADDYDFIMAKAITSLQKLSKTFTKENFENSLENLEQAQKMKQNKVEPYFYLAWLFLFADEITFATKYMNVVNTINPNFDGLDILKEEISTIQLIDTKEKKNNQEEKQTLVNPIQQRAEADNQAKRANGFGKNRVSRR